MIKGNRVLAGFVLAMLVAGALSGAAAVADEGVDEGVEQNEALEEDAALQLVEDAVEVEEEETAPAAEEPMEAVPTDDGDAEPAAVEPAEPDSAAESGDGGHEPRPRPVRSGRGGAAAAAAALSSAQPEPEGQGTVEFDPESAAGMCPGTAMKIDNPRSNGTFGPITISDFTNTSFTWTSTESVSAVLVKDGGGHKTNPGGTSGSASTFGQDISHVIFCLGGEAPDVDGEEPCDADESMPGTQPCEEPCDADESMPGTQPCEEPCDADGSMPGTQPCEEPVACDSDETKPGTQPCEEPCDADETMPGTQPCVPAVCDADETMPGRQDCDKGVAGAESKPQESEDDEVQGAGLAADGEPDRGPSPAQPLAAQPAAQGAILPFTGGPVFPLLLVAMGLVTAGGGAILIRRP